MKKFILGILLVFCVQLAFVAYNSTSRDIVAVNKLAGEVNSSRDPLSYAIANSQADPEAASIGEESPRLTPDFIGTQARKTRSSAPSIVSRRGVDNKNPIKAKHRPSPRRELRVLASHKAVKGADKDLAEKKPVRLERTDLLFADEEPRRKDKSFIAKALPIIKKPYDWLKAIGSKLR